MVAITPRYRCRHTFNSGARARCAFSHFSVSRERPILAACRGAPMHRRLSVAECLKRAEQCRDFARRAKAAEHSVMLDHMAETWERIAVDVRQSQHELLRLPIPRNKNNSRVVH